MAVAARPTILEMTARVELAPGVPTDWYRRIAEAEESHYWYRGMEAITVALLGDRMYANLRVLDAGCGAGGFIRFLLDKGRFARAAGVDLATAAIDFASQRVPEADLRAARLTDLPFQSGSFDLAVSNDVLQHIDESEIDASLTEIRRVLTPGGSLLVRTNGSRRLRVERTDWRAYDRKTLGGQIAAAGFDIERLTYANLVQSLVASALGRAPHAPTDKRHGVPSVEQGALRRTIGLRLLQAEASWLVRPGRSLPFGHTLVVLAKS